MGVAVAFGRLCCLWASLLPLGVAVAFGHLCYFGSSIMHGEIIWIMESGGISDNLNS